MRTTFYICPSRAISSVGSRAPRLHRGGHGSSSLSSPTKKEKKASTNFVGVFYLQNDKRRTQLVSSLFDFANNRETYIDKCFTLHK